MSFKGLRMFDADGTFFDGLHRSRDIAKSHGFVPFQCRGWDGTVIPLMQILIVYVTELFYTKSSKKQAPVCYNDRGWNRALCEMIYLEQKYMDEKGSS